MGKFVTSGKLRWYCQRVQWELDLFQSISNEMEKAITSKFANVQNDIQELKELQVDESLEPFTHQKESRLEYELSNWSTFAPNIIRGSLFISVYGLVERRLMNLCWLYEEDAGVKLKDLSRYCNMFESMTFFRKKQGITFPQEYCSGAEGQLLKHIRNVYAHKVCYTDNKGKRKIEQWLRDRSLKHYKKYVTLNGIKKRPDDEIVEFRIEFDNEFVTFVIDRAREMFRNLIDELIKKLNA